MNVNIQTQGIEEIEQLLAQISAKAQNLSPIFHDMGNSLSENIEERFDSESDFDGNEWDPLADSTLIAKSKKGKGSNKMLQLDKDLYESIGFYADDISLVVGVNAQAKGYAYPLVHQFGSKDGKTPARRFMPIDSDGNLDEGVKEEVLDLLEEFLTSF